MKFDDLIPKNLRLFALMVLAFLLIAVILGFSVFFFVLRGEERVMVPNVQGKELAEAMLELQSRELNTRIQLRYSQEAGDRGLVLEQDPGPGMVVKAGRRVRLVVSQGAVINRVESFLDRELAEVRKELPGRTSTLFVAEPVMYRQSDKPAGTILQQSPETGAALSGPAALHLVVSAGRGNAGTTVPGFAGLEPAGALERAGVAGLFLEFAAGEAGEGETAGTVIAQSPPEGASAGSDTRISLTVAAPAALQDGEVFGIFGYAMQELPFPLPVRLQAGLPSGNVVLLAELDFPGGWFSLPFTLPVGSVLTLSALGVAVHSEVVRG